MDILYNTYRDFVATMLPNEAELKRMPLAGKRSVEETLSDITDSNAMNGLDESLLNDFINALLPEAPTIGKVVDDERLQRIY